MSIFVRGAVGLLALGLAGPIGAQQSPAIRFDVPSQDLATALQQYAMQADREILYAPGIVQQQRTAGIHGEYPLPEALEKLLKGTNLKFRITDTHTILIEGTGALESAAPSNLKEWELAQGTAGPAQNAASTEGLSNDQPSNKKGESLSEVVVTGSRIPASYGQPAPDLRTYTREQIDRSGQTTIGEFLNTLPEISTSVTEAETFGGATTVRLHGLPVGTTLMLVNGRRVESSGAEAFSDFFDLNTIPVSAIDRIDVLPSGSSAIYGSDAIAGVVNLILKKNFTGVDASVKYGAATGVHETTVSAALGKEWDRGSFSVMGTFLSRDSLLGSQRALTDSYDRTPYGGTNVASSNCSAANVYSSDGMTPLPGLGGALSAGAIGNTSGIPTLSRFIPNRPNQCPANARVSLIPASQRESLISQGSYDFDSFTQGFSELLYSHVRQDAANGSQVLQYLTLGAANPYNPFGTDVTLSGQLANSAENDVLVTDYYRVLAGLRGRMLDTWRWELAGWFSGDRTAESFINGNLDYSGLQSALDGPTLSTALNPFAAHNTGTSVAAGNFLSNQNNSYSGKLWTINGFMRGEPVDLPAGPLRIVVGGEFNRNSLSFSLFSLTASRTSYSVFGEAKIPIVGTSRTADGRTILEAGVAVRYDHYNDFGGTTNPQYSLDWSPLHSITMHAGYGTSFKAPPLANLHLTQTAFQIPIVDPSTGSTDLANYIFGGNPHLKPTTGKSSVYGIAYEDASQSGLRASVTGWRIDETGSIQSITGQTIVDNASLFPGAVVRGGPGGAITLVNGEYVNFGDISVSGIDYDLSYKLSTPAGIFRPAISATQTYRYEGALIPGASSTDRVSRANDDGNFAPRWKGMAAMDWESGALSAHLAERYMGRYQDYDSTRTLGGQGLLDINVRYHFAFDNAEGVSASKGVTLEVGAINALNRLPTYSNYGGGLYGYDPREADIRGRFIYAQIGARL